MGWKEEMVEPPGERVEETDCRIGGRKSAWGQGFVSWFFPVCRLPPGYLAVAEGWRGLVKELFKTSRAVAECWLMSYSLIAPSSCELLSSRSQRKGWIILQQLPLQHLGSTRADPGSLGAAQPPQPPQSWDAPTVQGTCWNLSTVLVPPTAAVLALIQVLDLSKMDNPVCSLCPCWCLRLYNGLNSLRRVMADTTSCQVPPGYPRSHHGLLDHCLGLLLSRGPLFPPFK